MSVLQRAVLIFLLVLVIVGCNRGTQNKDPDAAKIITEDIERFWEAYDAGGSADDFQKLYLNRGPEALKPFAKEEIENAETLSFVAEARRNYYESIREETLLISKYEPAIRTSFEAMEELYPKAVFPNVYFFVGAMSAAGKQYSPGLVIAAEMVSLDESAITYELDDWAKEVVRTSDVIPSIVAHELIHYQQPPRLNPFTKPSLLYQTLIEGNADFIAGLISDEPLATQAHDYAEDIEEELWLEFQKVMHGNNYDDWLYGLGDKPNRPVDLGYWMGYKVAEAYYEQAEDKTQAVADIIQMKDADAFLEASGYAEKFN